MKNLRLRHILTVLVIILPTAVHGAQICGRISGNVIHASDGHGYMGVKGGTHSGTQWEAVELNNAFDFGCLNYTSDISSPGDLELFHHYLSYASVQTNRYSCAMKNRYSSSGCVACPDGSVASDNDFHQETECRLMTGPDVCRSMQYFTPSGECKSCPMGSFGSNPADDSMHGSPVCDFCSEGYYWPGDDATSCVLCPLGEGEVVGTLKPPSLIVKQRRSITECCKSSSTEFIDNVGTYSFSEECCYSE